MQDGLKTRKIKGTAYNKTALVPYYLIDYFYNLKLIAEYYPNHEKQDLPNCIPTDWL